MNNASRAAGRCHFAKMLTIAASSSAGPNECIKTCVGLDCPEGVRVLF